MKRLLFLNARRRVFFIQTLKTYIKKSSLKIEIASNDIDYFDPISKFVDHFKILPASHSSSFPSELLGFIESSNIFGIILWNNHDFMPISLLSEKIRSLGTKILLPPPNLIDVCFNKTMTYNFLLEHSIPTPKTYINLKELMKDNDVNYPLIVKPFDGSGNRYIYNMHSLNELDFIKKRVPNPIAQEKIVGIHYTIDTFNNEDGIPISVVPRRRLKVRDAEVVIARVEMKPSLIDLGRCLAGKFGIPGPMNIQVIEKDNVPYVIDIHPRIGGGTDLTIKAGAPFHIWCLNLLLGNKIDPKHQIDDGLIMSRYFSSTFFK